MRYRLRHLTSYAYQDRVLLGQNLACLTPRETSRQRIVVEPELRIDPQPTYLRRRSDYFGNSVHYLSFGEGYGRLDVEATSTVEVTAPDRSRPDDSPAWETVRDGLGTDRSPEAIAATQHRYPSPHVTSSGDLIEIGREAFTPGRPIVSALKDLTSLIATGFEYAPQTTTVSTTVDEVLRERRGVCQDFAHVQIAILRALGLAARYVSGYLRTYPPEGEVQRRGADASHAWLSLYCGPLGWVDADPTNDLLVEDEHVTVAWGRDFGDVSPLRGVLTGGSSVVPHVEVELTPIDG